MTAYTRLIARFHGQRPTIDCRSPTQYRASYPSWHTHSGVCTGAPAADGKTLELACEALIAQIDALHVELVEGSCSQPCANRYTASPKFKLAHRRLLDSIRGAAAEVDRWPAWKRGLPPCANCDLADGHPGECA